MSKRNIWLLVLVLIVICAGMIYLANWSFNEFDGVKTLFAGETSSPAVGEVAPGDSASLAEKRLFAGRISAGIYAVILFLQLAAFITAYCVLRSIKLNNETPELKIKELENADIFFDVPLYIGLFGTVSSFLVMSFSPLSGQLIAYSSTLVGIIFGVVLRVVLLYPLKAKLLLAAEKKSK